MRVRCVARVTPASLPARARASDAYRHLFKHEREKHSTVSASTFRREHTHTIMDIIWIDLGGINSEYNCACNMYSSRRVCGPFVYFNDT